MLTSGDNVEIDLWIIMFPRNRNQMSSRYKCTLYVSTIHCRWWSCMWWNIFNTDKDRTICFISWLTPRNWQWRSIRKKLYEKSDFINFTIVDFPSTCRKALSYVIYISQLIRYSRCCGSRQYFIDNKEVTDPMVLND